MIFGDHLRELHERRSAYSLHEHHSKEKGRVKAADLDELCPDWREREAFLSGPRDMIDAMEEHWKREGDSERLHTERFQPTIGEGTEDSRRAAPCASASPTATPSASRASRSSSAASVAGATLPFGCRMGICHTCVGRLAPAGCATCAPARSRARKGRWSAPASPLPTATCEIEL